jgi:hypothetical protein
MEECFDDVYGAILWVEMLDLFGLRLFPKEGRHHAWSHVFAGMWNAIGWGKSAELLFWRVSC